MKYLPESGEVAEWEAPVKDIDDDEILGIGEDDDDDDSDEDDNDKSKGSGKEGGGVAGWLGKSAVGSFFANVTGNKARHQNLKCSVAVVFWF